MFHYFVNEVERVLDKRVRDGRPEYLVKCTGQNRNESRWMRPENLHCERLIREYELSQHNGQRPVRNEEVWKFGFSRGLEPETILGVNNSFGRVTFLIKWQGRDDPDVVPAHQATEKCPALVIEFFEQRLKKLKATINNNKH